VIVHRSVDGRKVVSIINTSGSETVGLPNIYASSWKVAVSHGLAGSDLAPYGFLIAQK
jgi:hypothetical protein